jgi:hypothetical protein
MLTFIIICVVVAIATSRTPEEWKEYLKTIEE